MTTTAAPAPRAPRPAPDRRRDEAPRPSLRALDRPTRAPKERRARPRRDRRVVVGAAAALLLGLVLTLNLLVHTQATSGQFQLTRLERQAAEDHARYQRLRLEVAQLEAPQRIVAEAQRIGMVEPPRITYLAPTDATAAPTPTSAPPARAGAEQADATGAWQQVKRHLASGRP